MTILNWSFPRKDIPRSQQAFQLALALRDEVADLEKAGCKVIQVSKELEPSYFLSIQAFGRLEAVFLLEIIVVILAIRRS